MTWKAIRSTGGWVEGYVYLTPSLHNHTGMLSTIPITMTSRASPIPSSGGPATELLQHSALGSGGEKKKFRIGLEFTFRKTEYKDPASTGRLPNSGFGIHPQFQWLF